MIEFEGHYLRWSAREGDMSTETAKSCQNGMAVKLANSGLGGSLPEGSTSRSYVVEFIVRFYLNYIFFQCT
jgi:hypothetical protein